MRVRRWIPLSGTSACVPGCWGLKRAGVPASSTSWGAAAVLARVLRPPSCITADSAGHWNGTGSAPGLSRAPSCCTRSRICRTRTPGKSGICCTTGPTSVRFQPRKRLCRRTHKRVSCSTGTPTTSSGGCSGAETKRQDVCRIVRVPACIEHLQ